jgi:hypothetical protein
MIGRGGRRSLAKETDVDEALERMAAALGVPALTDAEQQLLLDGSERRHAPLSTFLLGMAVSSGEVDRATALAEAVSRVVAVVTDADTPPDPPER